MSANYRTLAPAVEGVYVVQFDDRVKLGMTGKLRGRLRAHGKAGATRARVWIARDDQSLWRVEEEALAAAALVGHRIGKTESFTGLTFGQACDILRSVTARRWGGPVHEIDGFTADVVLPFANSIGWRHGWNGSHLLEAAS